MRAIRNLLKKSPDVITRFRRISGMENVRSQRVRRSLFQNRSHHSSGQECIRMKNIFQEQRIVKHAFNEQLNRKSLRYNWHDADVTVLEGVFARGDRKTAKPLKKLIVWDACMIPGAINLIMRNGCRRLKIQALISHSIITGSALMKCSRGISLISA